MDEPSTRVVQLEGDGQVAISWKSRDIAPSRVGGVEFRQTRQIDSYILGKNPEVVAVKVDRMRKTACGWS